ALIVIASLLGKLLKVLVWENHWDLKHPSLFKFGNTWLYTLTGRGKRTNPNFKNEIIPVIDALAELGGKTRLYRGIIFDFNTDDTGSLQEIFITEARRGKFIPDETEPEKTVFMWEKIPGDIFMLPYKTLINLNITYFDPKNTQTPFP